MHSMRGRHVQGCFRVPLCSAQRSNDSKLAASLPIPKSYCFRTGLTNQISIRDVNPPVRASGDSSDQWRAKNPELFPFPFPFFHTGSALKKSPPPQPRNRGGEDDNL